jgi:hypothetical protein
MKPTVSFPIVFIVSLFHRLHCSFCQNQQAKMMRSRVRNANKFKKKNVAAALGKRRRETNWVEARRQGNSKSPSQSMHDTRFDDWVRFFPQRLKAKSLELDNAVMDAEADRAHERAQFKRLCSCDDCSGIHDDDDDDDDNDKLDADDTMRIASILSTLF